MAAETINMRTASERKRRLQVIADRRTSPLPAAFFDEFLDALAPEPTPALIDAAARLRQSVRRDN